MPEPLTFLATCDLVSIVRGRARPDARAARRAEGGVGWVPADLACTTFGEIVTPNAFGTLGDLRILPAEGARVRLAATAGRPPLDLVLGDLVEPEGTPWRCCPRTALAAAIDRFHARTGLHLKVAFEQELTLAGVTPGPPFSLASLRSAEPFGSLLVAALGENGLGPETWLAEYGSGQYELTLTPADPMTAADRAILAREILRDLAAAHGHRAILAPVVRPEAVGNGTHIHLSLWDAAGRPVTLDPATLAPTPELSRFVAGVLAHAPALAAWTAPSTISWLRLQPGRWSAGAAFFGRQNREALVRLCAVPAVDGASSPAGAHIEYRAADATANPWLALAALIHAGTEGFARDLPAPPCIEGSLDGLDGPERAALGIGALPADLGAALDALDADPIARGWFADDLVGTHLLVRRAEIARLAGATDAEACAAYGQVI